MRLSAFKRWEHRSRGAMDGFPMRVWIDVENPPQVRYLLPCARALESAGCEVVLTGRDYGNTVALLESESVSFTTIGGRFGKKRRQKLVGLTRRVRGLDRYVASGRRPDLVLSASRPASIVAWRRRFPAFVLIDYEHVDFSIYRMTGSYVLHPDVIPAESLLASGIRRERLISFSGLKEDLSFAGIGIDTLPAHRFDAAPGQIRILFRPPAEESHYHSSDSRDVALALLRYLADRESAVLVYSPRYPWQETHLEGLQWRNEPIVLREPVHFVSLLKGVDVVVSAGGTMTREAAYLGLPSYSILQSKIGAVDRYLESIGRLTVLSSIDDFRRIELRPSGRKPLLETNPQLVNQLVEKMLRRSVHLNAEPVPDRSEPDSPRA